MTVTFTDGHSSAIDLAGGERIADPFHDIESQDKASQTTRTTVRSSSPNIGTKAKSSYTAEAKAGFSSILLRPY